MGKIYLKQIATLFSGNVFAQVIPFLVAPLISRMYSPEDLGTFQAFLACVSLVGMVACGRLELALILPEQKSEAKHIFHHGFRILWVLCLVLQLLIFCFPQVLSSWFEIPSFEKIQWTIPLGVMLLGLNNLLYQWELREGKIMNLSLNRLLRSAGINLIPLGLAWLGMAQWGLLIGWYLGMAGALLQFLVLGFKSRHVFMGRLQWDKSLMFRYKEFYSINALHAGMDILFSQFLLFGLVSNSFGLATLGFFGATVRYIKAPLNIISSSVSQVFFKTIANTNASNEQSSSVLIFKNNLKFMIPLGIMVGLTLWFFGEWLFTWYLGDAWQAVGVYSRILAPAFGAGLISSSLSTIPLVYKKQKWAFGASLFAYLLSIGVFVLKWDDFETALGVYSLIQTGFFVSLVIWYRVLIQQE